MNKIIVFTLSLALLIGCSTPRKAVRSVKEMDHTGANWELADSILNEGLHAEALFTLLGDVKPMSSLVAFSLPLIKKDTIDPSREQTYYKRLKDLEELVATLNDLDLPDLKFILIPYKNFAESKRLLQVSVVRVSKLDSLLTAQQDFFGRFGFVRGTVPEVVVNSIEFSEQRERLRAYGYLFGYPDYAVDFFTQAFLDNERTGEFVKRDFFQIPSYSSKTGDFVYAMPKGHTPTQEVDSLLYYRAKDVLDRYKSIRPNYVRSSDTTKVEAYRLLKDFWKAK